MLHHVAVVKTDVPEEPSASIITVTRMGEKIITLLVKVNVVPSLPILVTIVIGVLSTSEAAVFTRTT
jgi:hypothetical protein